MGLIEKSSGCNGAGAEGASDGWLQAARTSSTEPNAAARAVGFKWKSSVFAQP